MNDELNSPELVPVQPSQTPFVTVKVVLLVIHILYSVIGCIVFYNNQWMLSMIMCLLLMFVCILYLYLILLVTRGELTESCIYMRLWYFTFLPLKLGVGQVIAIYFSIKNVVEKKDPEKFNDQCATIFTSFVTCLWSFILAYEFWCRKKERSNTVLVRNGTAYFF